MMYSDLQFLLQVHRKEKLDLNLKADKEGTLLYT